MTDPRSVKAIEEAAATLCLAFNKFMADLPHAAAPQEALEEVVRILAIRQPWIMRLIMEDPAIREAYDAAVASSPLKVKNEDDIDLPPNRQPASNQDG
jgi:hypothetical protein